MKSGIDADGIATTEADHFGNCPVCGALVDMRDLGQVLAHIHGAVIEIEEGDAPPAPGEGCNRALCARKMLARIGVMRALNRHVEREWQRG